MLPFTPRPRRFFLSPRWCWSALCPHDPAARLVVGQCLSIPTRTEGKLHFTSKVTRSFVKNKLCVIICCKGSLLKNTKTSTLQVDLMINMNVTKTTFPEVGCFGSGNKLLNPAVNGQHFCFAPSLWLSPPLQGSLPSPTCPEVRCLTKRCSWKILKEKQMRKDLWVPKYRLDLTSDTRRVLPTRDVAREVSSHP